MICIYSDKFLTRHTNGLSFIVCGLLERVRAAHPKGFWLIWQPFAYLGYGLSMHHVVAINEIEVVGVLKLRSQVGVTESHPNGRRLRINVEGWTAWPENHTSYSDPEYVMNSDHRAGVKIAVPTNTGSIRVKAKTLNWIMVDFQYWYGRDTVEFANVIFSTSYFEQAFLKQRKYYCRLAGTEDENPYQSTITHTNPRREDVRDEENHNPAAPMAQANPYTIATDSFKDVMDTQYGIMYIYTPSTRGTAQRCNRTRTGARQRRVH